MGEPMAVRTVTHSACVVATDAGLQGLEVAVCVAEAASAVAAADDSKR